jgi:hypothetical protein
MCECQNQQESSRCNILSGWGNESFLQENNTLSQPELTKNETTMESIQKWTQRTRDLQQANDDLEKEIRYLEQLEVQVRCAKDKIAITREKVQKLSLEHQSQPPIEELEKKAFQDTLLRYHEAMFNLKKGDSVYVLKTPMYRLTRVHTLQRPSVDKFVVTTVDGDVISLDLGQWNEECLPMMGTLDTTWRSYCCFLRLLGVPVFQFEIFRFGIPQVAQYQDNAIQYSTPNTTVEELD